jgi:hypothetical protein
MVMIFIVALPRTWSLPSNSIETSVGAVGTFESAAGNARTISPWAKAEVGEVISNTAQSTSIFLSM